MRWIDRRSTRFWDYVRHPGRLVHKLIDRRSTRLWNYFRHNPGRQIHKWDHYFPIYERHFGPLRKRHPTVLEIGVSQGGSLEMWRAYFGRGSHIVGIDIDERCTAVAGPGVDVRIGDQTDRAFLMGLVDEFGPFDIVIDDGGHRPEQIRASFDALWPSINLGGVYLVEDLHANYWPEYGGAYLAPESFVEYGKSVIDEMHAWHSRDPALEVTAMTRSLRGLHIYDSIMVFDKADVPRPHVRKTGRPALVGPS
jgi:hypothetical protein